MRKTKKTLLWLSLLAIFIPYIATPMQAGAQTGDLFFGQEHSYSVIFRGNGEAVVYGKIDFTNTGDNPVKKFTIDIPGSKPGDFMALQYVSQINNCTGYSSITSPMYCPPVPYSNSSSITVSPSVINSLPATSYQKLKFTNTGSIYELQLSQEVASKQKSSFVFAYVVSGYVKKSLGVYKFNFETPKVDARIKNINVAVDVDSELSLKGKRSEVQYATSGLTSSFSGAMADSSRMSFPSATLSSAVNSIGNNGPVQKNAQNLAPNESLVVSGEYANNKWSLVWFSITWKILLGLLIIIGAIFLVRKWRINHPVLNSPVSKKDTSDENVFHLLHPMYSTIGLGAALFIIGFYYIITTFYNQSFLGNQNSMALLMMVMIFLIFILAISIVPAVIIGVKYGWRAGVSVAVNMVLWFMVIMLIYATLKISGLWPEPMIKQYPYPYYY